MDNDFTRLRDEWALKHPYPSKDRLDSEFRMDQLANPHNEPYHNKKPRRSEAQIVSDLAYTFADNVLLQQHGTIYKTWLSLNGIREKWGVLKAG